MPLILSILAATFSIGGNILIAFKNKLGWCAWCVGNLLWIWESMIDSLNIPLIVMNTVYFAINSFSFHYWRKEEKKKT